MNFCGTFLASSVLLIPVLALHAFSQGPVPVNSSDIADRARQLLDKGVCDFKAKNYALAQTDFQNALQLDPTNKFLPVFLARAIYYKFQPDVQTASNLAKGREAIAAYEKVLARNPGDAEAANTIADIYEQIDPEHLQETAANETLTKDVRTRIYVRLAGKSNSCVLDITETNRTEVNSKGQRSFRYHMPRNKADLQKGLTCAREGTKFIEKAIALAPDDETSWSYKAALLIQLARLAEMEQRADEQAAYTKQGEQARSVFRKLSDAARDRQRKADEDEQKIEVRRKTAEEEYPELVNFAATGKRVREPKIDGSEVEPPLARLVAPIYDGDGGAKEKPIIRVKLPWKTFTPKGGAFTALMPSPVEIAGSESYTVESEDIRFFISSTKIPTDAPVNPDKMLVTAAFAASDAVCIFSLMAKSTCEVSFVRKLTLDNDPGAQYSIAETKCGKVFPGLLRVYATKNRIYSVIVTGANEDDPRVSRFLNSFSPVK